MMSEYKPDYQNKTSSNQKLEDTSPENFVKEVDEELEEKALEQCWI